MRPTLSKSGHVTIAIVVVGGRGHRLEAGEEELGDVQAEREARVEEAGRHVAEGKHARENGEPDGEAGEAIAWLVADRVEVHKDKRKGEDEDAENLLGGLGGRGAGVV